MTDITLWWKDKDVEGEPMAYSTLRDMEKRPYSPEEQRVAEYLVELTGIGGGDDPVGFLIASHRALAVAVKGRGAA